MNKYTDLDIELYDYILEILNNPDTVGEAEYLAVVRFNEWFTTNKYWFDNEKVNQIFYVISLLKHFEDPFTGQSFILIPWLKFVVANIFGWYLNNDHTKRIIKNVLMLISRKSGKSSLSAAIAIAAIIADGIKGGEAFLVSNTRDQAKILYKYVSGFIKSIDPKNKYFRTFRDNLTYIKNNYTLKVLASEAMHNDGYNPSLFILDEFHAAQDYDLYNVMKSGLAMRKNPLGIIISSAGSLLSGYPLYESVKVAYDVLRGMKVDDNSFYAIYLMKETDDWKDEKNWRKASPNYKITVSEDYMRERITEAENDVSKESDVKTKNLNIWCNAVSAWITLDIVVNSMYHVDLNDFLGETAYMGIDLSETNDLTAVSVLLPPNSSRDKWPDKYVFKSVAYIPGIAMKRSKNRTIYLGFLNKGEAKLTSGETVDYNEVVSDIKSVCSKLNVEKIGFDKFNAINLVRMCEEEGFPMEAYSLTLLNFNIPSKAFFELIMNGMVVIDKSTVTTFCFNNVELRYDKNRNIKPSLPEDDRNKKIDIVISMLEALGIYLSENLYYYGE